jgi:hypothetical protein
LDCKAFVTADTLQPSSKPAAQPVICRRADPDVFPEETTTVSVVETPGPSQLSL